RVVVALQLVEGGDVDIEVSNLVRALVAHAATLTHPALAMPSHHDVAADRSSTAVVVPSGVTVVSWNCRAHRRSTLIGPSPGTSGAFSRYTLCSQMGTSRAVLSAIACTIALLRADSSVAPSPSCTRNSSRRSTSSSSIG